MSMKLERIDVELKYILITSIGFLLLAIIGEFIMVLIHDSYPMALFFSTMGFSIIAIRTYRFRRSLKKN